MNNKLHFEQLEENYLNDIITALELKINSLNEAIYRLENSKEQDVYSKHAINELRTLKYFFEFLLKRTVYYTSEYELYLKTRHGNSRAEKGMEMIKGLINE